MKEQKNNMTLYSKQMECSHPHVILDISELHMDCFAEVMLFY